VALLVPAVAASASQAPVTSWSPTTSSGTYSYGTLDAGQTVSQTFTLANSGGSATSGLTVTLTGSAAFTVTADSCTGTSLGPRKSCTVTVSYAPASAGQADSAMLTATAPKGAATVSLALNGATSSPSVLTVTTDEYSCGGTCWGAVSGSGLEPNAAVNVYGNGSLLGAGAVDANGDFSSPLALSCGSGWNDVYTISTTSAGATITSNVVNTPCG
jgi:hypothetical protein